MPLVKVKPSLLEDVHEFHPALVEIQDNPSHPVARWLFWGINSFFILALAWMCLADMDVVVSAKGRFIPAGHVKTIQPLETGVLKSILVKEGQWVKKNQPLLVVDPSGTQPGYAGLHQQIIVLQQELIRLKAHASQHDYTGHHEVQKALYDQDTLELHQQLAGKQKEIEQTQAELAGTHAEKVKEQELLTLATQKEAQMRLVLDIIAREDYDRVINDIAQHQGRIRELQHKEAELQFKEQNLYFSRGAITAGYQKTHWEEFNDRSKQLVDTQAKLAELQFKLKQQVICAPVDGVVDSLSVYTTGGVVVPAQKLMTIIPRDTPLVIQASIPNRDSGFVHIGQVVQIKLDAFDYQKYGLIPGNVTWISPDSRSDNKNTETTYEVWVKPKQTSLLVNGKHQPLKTGYAATAEIHVAKRKVIEFFIYPLIQNLQEGTAVR